MARFSTMLATLAAASFALAQAITAAAQDDDESSEGEEASDLPDGSLMVVGLLGLLGLVFVIMAITDGDDNNDIPHSP